MNATMARKSEFIGDFVDTSQYFIQSYVFGIKLVGTLCVSKVLGG